MLYVAAVTFFVMSFLNGAWAKPSGKKVGFAERLVCLFCGATSIAIGLIFGVSVLFLMADGGDVVVEGIVKTSILLLSAFVPGLLGIWAAISVKKKTAYLDAETALE